MQDKKYQVFISSTFVDLEKARDEVIKVVLSLYHIPIGMEMFSADNDDQWKTIQRTIDKSDYYIIIIGQRYGSLSEEEKISFTEKEYNYAKEIGVPILAFIRDRNVPTSPKERDEDPALATSLNKFIEKVKKNTLCEFWETDVELGRKVAIALPKIFANEDRPGWVRASASSAQLSEELAFLSRENRSLKEQLTKYEQAPSVKPQLEILANGEKEITLVEERIRIWDLCTEIDPTSIPSDIIAKLPEDYIQRYNQRIKENKEDIDTYTEQLKRASAKENKIVFSIKNVGNVKAKMIYAEVTLPEGLIMYTKETLPSKPKRPKNVLNHPLNEAAEFSLLKVPNFLTANLNESFTFSSKLNLPVPFDANRWEDIEGNKITLFRKELLHTRASTYDDMYLYVPDAGEYELDIKIICEEYLEPQIFKMKVQVNEN